MTHKLFLSFFIFIFFCIGLGIKAMTVIAGENSLLFFVFIKPFYFTVDTIANAVDTILI